MRNRAVVVAALLCAAPVLLAQETKKPAAEQQMPNPKVKEHDALKAFVGSWESTCKMHAVPGVPGMDKEMEAKATEHAELICSGLYLKVDMNGMMGGQPYQGCWVAGYDPFRKTYTSLWVDSESGSAFAGTGTHDATRNTWEFSGESPQGMVRSVVDFHGADSFTETCYVKGSDGKDVKCMEITRTRSKAALPLEASIKIEEPQSKEIEALHKSIGTWDASLRFRQGAEAKWTEEKGTEVVTPICCGKWLWTDFRGQMMGQPFTGSGITGFDTKQNKVVSFWMDSMSPVAMESTGTRDEAKKTVTMEGKGVDMAGKPFRAKEVVTWTDDDTRVLTMDFTGEEGPSTMEITYKRTSRAKGKSGY